MHTADHTQYDPLLSGDASAGVLDRHPEWRHLVSLQHTARILIATADNERFSDPAVSRLVSFRMLWRGTA